jgi:archaellum component FlaG (FlaF/FlaG flagellin family)
MARRHTISESGPAGNNIRSWLKVPSATLLFLLAWISGPLGMAQDISPAAMKGLDEQVQEIKSDVLSIAADLNVLEERLLYPSNTHVAIFIDIADGQKFRLDSVQIQVDGNLVAHHIYSFKELEALQMGGVQRIYTGNIPTGEHEIKVAVAGKHGSGKDFSSADSFLVSKNVEPKLVGITLTEPGLTGSGIELGNW